jgi:hypothetical protein
VRVAVLLGVTFSEEIDNTTFDYTSTPDPGGWSWVWSAGNTVATGSHANFAQSTSYTFNVTQANDTSANQLDPGPVPNPWSWTTEAPPVVPTEGNITGMVEDENGDPLAGVTVTLRNSTGAVVDTQTTDSTGTFNFLDVTEGALEYSVNAEKAHYESAQVVDINVTASQTENIGTITLVTDASISGKVTSDGGVDIEDATVELLDDSGNVVATTTTNSQGIYVFIDIGYGTYTIRIGAPGFVTKTTPQFTVDSSNLDIARPDEQLTAESAEPDEGLPGWLWILLIIIVIVVVLILLLFLLKRRKKGSEEDVPQTVAEEGESLAEGEGQEQES